MSEIDEAEFTSRGYSFDVRRTSVAQREHISRAQNLLREGEFDQADKAADLCLDGAYRVTALRIKARALLKIDPVAAEAASRQLLNENGEDAGAQSLLAAALKAQSHAAAIRRRETNHTDMQLVRTARGLMREGRFAEASALVAPCLDGEHRVPALMIVMRAVKRIDPAQGVEVAEALIHEGVSTQEVLSNLRLFQDVRARRDAIAQRAKSVSDRKAVREATHLLREGRAHEALELVGPALDGAYRVSALRIKVAALMSVDRAAAEGSIRELIAEGGHTDDLGAKLSGAEAARKRKEALDARERRGVGAKALSDAITSVRQKDYESAVELTESCLDGPYRDRALKVRRDALAKLDPVLHAEEIADIDAEIARVTA